MAMHRTVLDCTELHRTALHLTTLHWTTPHLTALRSDCAARRQSALHLLPEDVPTLAQAMAQRISMALMKAQAHVIHMRARPQEDPAALLFRTTVHTAADLDYIGRE